MGMSADYEMALAHGSTNVRIGSAIFGARVYAAGKAKAIAAGGDKKDAPAATALE
jgi:hypothetical protein